MTGIDRALEERLQETIYVELYNGGARFDRDHVVPRVAAAVRELLAPRAAADAVHHLVVDGQDFEFRLRLVCTAAAGAPCRRRPTDDRETWSINDPDLVDCDCLAVEWAEEAGLEVLQPDDEGEFGRIPVALSWDEGPVLARVAAAPTLPLGGSDV